MCRLICIMVEGSKRQLLCMMMCNEFFRLELVAKETAGTVRSDTLHIDTLLDLGPCRNSRVSCSSTSPTPTSLAFLLRSGAGAALSLSRTLWWPRIYRDGCGTAPAPAPAPARAQRAVHKFNHNGNLEETTQLKRGDHTHPPDCTMAPRPTKRSIGIVALAAASFSADKCCVDGFVPPGGSTLSASASWQPSSSSLRMAVSLPDDAGNWEKPSSSSQPNDPGLDSSLGGGGDDADMTSSSDSLRFTTDQYDGYDGAFPLPDDAEIPETRQLRWEREGLVRSKFASGDEVYELRSAAEALGDQLAEARDQMDETTSPADKRRAEEMERDLRTIRGRDAEFMYAVSLELIERAEADGDEEEARNYKVQAEEARLCIPQLNMHGLWVGKYGEHGYEMINVTYSGDTLIATKVTGDRNVPKGEVSFTADLSPRISSGTNDLLALEPIELNHKAARQWGKRYLPRHVGKGQVASEDFSNAQWMEGQLILVGRFFSFAWVPIGHQVFFGRPSGELTIKMLREAREEELRRDHVAVMRDVAMDMLEETYWAEREADSFEEMGCFE
ncbi:hypothetical protein ACHAWF_017265 [Thalassiosira exigua]